MKLPRLLFDWPSRHNVHLALPLLLVASVLIHAGGLAVLQIAQPRSQTSGIHPAQVWFVPRNSPEARQLAPLLAAEDPALFSPAHDTFSSRLPLPATAYAPSFDEGTPSLLPARAGSASERLPEAALTGPLTDRLTPSAPPAALRPGPPTRISLGGELQGRTLTSSEPPAFSAPPKVGLKPAEFLVCAAPDGLILHIFPQNSSGYEALDRAALRYLASSRFDTSPGQTPAWGTATFLWGNDVQREKMP